MKKCLLSSDIPAPSADCEICSYVALVDNELGAKRAKIEKTEVVKVKKVEVVEVTPVKKKTRAPSKIKNSDSNQNLF
jgi:hypothetical protein